MAENRETDLVTVAAIRKKDKPQQILLNERQRIFVLAEKAALKGDARRLLVQALKKRTPIKVTLDTKWGGA